MYCKREELDVLITELLNCSNPLVCWPGLEDGQRIERIENEKVLVETVEMDRDRSVVERTHPLPISRLCPSTSRRSLISELCEE
jgi:hypothetical protein